VDFIVLKSRWGTIWHASQGKLVQCKNLKEFQCGGRTVQELVLNSLLILMCLIIVKSDGFGLTVRGGKQHHVVEME